MKKLIPFVLLLLSLALPAGAAMKTELSLPARAVEVSPGVFSLGTAFDKGSLKFVDGYAIVHKVGAARSSQEKAAKAARCYAVMSAGTKWKTVETWEVFPSASLDSSFLLNTITQSIGTWETAANSNILGTGALSTGIITDPYTLDSKNQVSFGDLETGTIAVTVVWGRFSGPTFTRELTAWDQIYNTDFIWTTDAAQEPTKMDFWNIATHELGHAMGLADIYNTSCSDVTMYGYGSQGETSKRDLAPDDITGINLLY